jgi:hypothetical protein
MILALWLSALSGNIATILPDRAVRRLAARLFGE